MSVSHICWSAPLEACAKLFQVRPCRFPSSSKQGIAVNENSVLYFIPVKSLKINTKLEKRADSEKIIHICNTENCVD